MYLMHSPVSHATKNQVFQGLRGGIEALSRRKTGFDSPWDHHIEHQGSWHFVRGFIVLGILNFHPLFHPLSKEDWFLIKNSS